MIREMRYLSSMEVRNLCIKHDWYTCGDNEQYDYLLNILCDKRNITTQDMVIIATDIKTHSETELSIAEIATALARIATTIFYEDYED